MALNKTVTLPTGATASYWRIGYIPCLDFKSNKLVVQMYGYVDQAARDADKEVVTIKEYAFSGDAFTFGNTSLVYADVYTSIKNMSVLNGEEVETNELFGATDI